MAYHDENEKCGKPSSWGSLCPSGLGDCDPDSIISPFCVGPEMEILETHVRDPLAKQFSRLDDAAERVLCEAGKM